MRDCLKRQNTTSPTNLSFDSRHHTKRLQPIPTLQPRTLTEQEQRSLRPLAGLKRTPHSDSIWEQRAPAHAKGQLLDTGDTHATLTHRLITRDQSALPIIPSDAEFIRRQQTTINTPKTAAQPASTFNELWSRGRSALSSWTARLKSASVHQPSTEPNEPQPPTRSSSY